MYFACRAGGEGNTMISASALIIQRLRAPHKSLSAENPASFFSFQDKKLAKARHKGYTGSGVIMII
jgi:hypothetical protein